MAFQWYPLLKFVLCLRDYDQGWTKVEVLENPKPKPSSSPGLELFNDDIGLIFIL